MRDAISRFDAFYTEFKKSELWKNMLTVRDACADHREENVAHHTRLATDWYLRNLAPNRSDQMIMLTGIACLFHDAGKTLVTPHSTAERLTHEFFSLELWFNYSYTARATIRDHLRLSQHDLSRISFIIFHHELSNLEGEGACVLKKSLPAFMDEISEVAWLDTVRSDQHGHYSDTHSKQLDRLYAGLAHWISIPR